MSDDHAWLGTELCASLHALSLDATEALAMQEPNQQRPAQLALSFGSAVLNIVSPSAPPVSPSLLATLNELAALLSRMSAHSVELWTDEAVRNHACWHEVRTLARRALTDLGVARNGMLLN